MVAGPFEAVERTFDDGQFLSAFRAARSAGVFALVRETPPYHSLLAARLYRACGGARRARKIILDTWRRHRRHPQAAVFAFSELSDDGPLAVLDTMERIGIGRSTP